MAPQQPDDPDLTQRAQACVAQVTTTLAANLPELGRQLHVEFAETIPELRGDPLILDLLRASTESNVDMFFQVSRYGLAMEEVSLPTAASEYARRLAQRGTSSNALLRAYRLGQRRVLDAMFEQIELEEADGRVAFAAARLLQDASFEYVDRVSVQVVEEYERERERWLANRNTVRMTTLKALLAGEDVTIAAAEQALGHRLRQNHLAVVIWSQDRESSTAELLRLEQLLASLGERLGSSSQPLFIPQDRSLGWGWISLGRSVPEIDLGAISKLAADAAPTLRVALGTTATGPQGFRTSHLDAVRAHRVATVAAGRALRVTSFADAGVRAVSLLTADIPAARELVATALGRLANDTDGSERLRETLLEFLQEKGSYVATADRVHLHKNTVKYRVDKAIEARGRPIDDDRFNLELALLTCRWFGEAVLAAPPT